MFGMPFVGLDERMSIIWQAFLFAMQNKLFAEQ